MLQTRAPLHVSRDLDHVLAVVSVLSSLIISTQCVIHIYNILMLMDQMMALFSSSLRELR